MEIRTTDRDLFYDVEKVLESIQLEPIDKDVAVIILKIDNPTMQTETKSYDLSILGKSMTNWVKSAFNNCLVTEVECDINADIISIIRPHLTDKKWTAVFYADTPLLQRRTFLNIVDWVQIKQLNVCKLERGWMFVTDYVKNLDEIHVATEEHDFGKEDFLTVCNMSQVENAQQILQQRIINFHQRNGVQILDRKSTFIDADVDIGKNIIIYPHNIICGNTKIEDNVTINPFCTIKSSKIGKSSTITCSYIENSEIKENSQILPYTTIINGEKK